MTVTAQTPKALAPLPDSRYSDWRCWAWVGGKYVRILATMPGVIEIRDEDGKFVQELHCFTAVQLEK